MGSRRMSKSASNQNASKSRGRAHGAELTGFDVRIRFHAKTAFRSSENASQREAEMKFVLSRLPSSQLPSLLLTIVR
jgi:hypothetical protein